jgi:hypothetical protein
MFSLAFTKLVYAAEGSGTATVPVETLLQLHEARETQPVPPPVRGVLESVSVQGRVLDDALELELDMAVSVLGSGWTEIPLLELGPNAELSPVEGLNNAWVVVRGSKLVLVSETAGRYTFHLQAQLPATQPRREVTFAVMPATSSRMTLKHDPAQVQLLSGDPRPQNGRYTVAWLSAQPAPALVSAPPETVEPIVERATASVVSTLEGTWLVRTHLDLRFEGRQTLQLQWPAEQKLERAYLNGVPIEAVQEGETLSVEVVPARGGGDRGTLELVSSRERVGYLLRGVVELEMLSLSWPVREWVCSLHLPEVFDYAWRGGSLVTSTATPPPPELFSYQVPTPGEVSVWHQQLVFSHAPTLRLGYTVELDGAYFRPQASAVTIP